LAPTVDGEPSKTSVFIPGIHDTIKDAIKIEPRTLNGCTGAHVYLRDG
jgi:hypothetical protein